MNSVYLTIQRKKLKQAKVYERLKRLLQGWGLVGPTKLLPFLPAPNCHGLNICRMILSLFLKLSNSKKDTKLSLWERSKALWLSISFSLTARIIAISTQNLSPFLSHFVQSWFSIRPPKIQGEDNFFFLFLQLFSDLDFLICI